jgi:hypothetical protein
MVCGHLEMSVVTWGWSVDTLEVVYGNMEVVYGQMEVV